jgi:hypothetical protein
MERLKSNGATVRVKLAVLILVNPTPVPSTVTLEVPSVAVEVAANVTVEEQFGLQPVGENAAVTPGGRPEAVKLMELLTLVDRVAETIVETLAV